MHRRLRTHVFDGQHLIVLIYNPGRLMSLDDFAKDTIVHASSAGKRPPVQLIFTTYVSVASFSRTNWLASSCACWLVSSCPTRTRLNTLLPWFSDRMTTG